MTCKNVRPVCAESNPVHGDPGTMARDRAPAPSSTGLTFSATPDCIWSRLMQGCYPSATQSKIHLLATNLSFLEHVHNEPRDSCLAGGVASPERLHDQDNRPAYSEQMNNHSQSVAAMAHLRETVKTLTPDELHLTADQFHSLKIYLNHKINDLAPYYTQMGNLDLLAGEGHRAWKRTCNVTSLSMAVEGLGVGPSGFNGDWALLERIATALEPWRVAQQIAEDKRVAKIRAKGAREHPKGKRAGPATVRGDDDWGACYSTLDGLRMPDFVQHVAVYTMFTDPPSTGKIKKVSRRAPESAFLQDVLAARNQAAAAVLSTDMLVKLAGQFGVRATPRFMESYGTVNRDLKETKKAEESFIRRRLEALQKQTGKELEKNSTEEKQAVEDIHSEDGFKKLQDHEKDDQDRLAKLKRNWSKNVDDYRDRVLKEVKPRTDEGAQIVVNRPGHFMKLHSIEPEGLLMDDPWTEGKRHLVLWAEAYEQGYFRSYIVLTR
jgi:hypothetical protein